MKKDYSFFKTVCTLAIPVTLQSMLQASFSIADQIMIGQLGSVHVAGVGLAAKFASIHSVVISAIGAVAGIMMSQYLGQKDNYEVRRSFYTNALFSVGISGIFTILCILFPENIMKLYTKDSVTCQAAASYLKILAGTFIPLAGATLLSTLFRCLEKPKLPLYASIVSAILNSGLNYLLIFGKLGFTPMGAQGAAIATCISQCVNFLFMLFMLPRKNSILTQMPKTSVVRTTPNYKQYFSILFPILICEILWSLGENVYAAIYGHMGTNASAAMTLINPIQGLLIGALCGLSQAASILIGKKLGNGNYEDAYTSSKKIIFYGAAGSVILSVIVILTSSFYVEIYPVDKIVKNLTQQILLAYALVAPFKVLNMILGGGIIRSGGQTKYVMFIDILGTWCFGIPLGLWTSFVLHLSIPYVYFILSLEECVRFALSLVLFRKKSWMQRLKSGV